MVAYRFGSRSWRRGLANAAAATALPCCPRCMQSHLECRLWNDIFVDAQKELGIPNGESGHRWLAALPSVGRRRTLHV